MPFEAVCTFYGNDFDRDQLRAQLLTFGTHFSPAQTKRGSIDIFGIRDYFRSRSLGQVVLCHRLLISSSA